MSSFKEVCQILASQPFQYSEYNIPDVPDWHVDLGINFIFGFCFKRSSFYHVDNTVEEMLGYDTHQFKKGGIDFLDKITHRDDLHYAVMLLHKGWNLILSQPYSYRKNFTLSVDYRLRKSDGCYLHLIQHFNQLITDSIGNIVYAQGAYCDITHWKKRSGPVLNIYYNSRLIESWNSNLLGELLSISRREKEILKLICSGKTSSEIAFQLNLSKHTVNSHKKSVMKKLKVNKATSLLLVARDYQLI